MRRNVEHHHGAYLVNGELIQTDWDYPATAESLGWSLRRVQPGTRGARVLRRQPRRGAGCDHRGTDGTVACRDCGVTASEFISAAAEYLDSLC